MRRHQVRASAVAARAGWLGCWLAPGAEWAKVKALNSPGKNSSERVYGASALAEATRYSMHQQPPPPIYHAQEDDRHEQHYTARQKLAFDHEDPDDKLHHDHGRCPAYQHCRHQAVVVRGGRRRSRDAAVRKNDPNERPDDCLEERAEGACPAVTWFRSAILPLAKRHGGNAYSGHIRFHQPFELSTKAR